MALTPIKSNKPELILAPEKLTLDELYQQADRLGHVEIGGISGRQQVEIKVSGLDRDYVCVRANTSDLKQNFHICIVKAKALRDFYRQQGW